MTSLRETIHRMRRELTGDVRWYHKVRDAVVDIIQYRPDWYYKILNFLRNFKLMMRLAWKWYAWNSHTTVEVLADLLERQAQDLKGGLCVNSEKNYRRCMAASGYLRKANDPPVDTALLHLYSKNKWYFKPIKGSNHSQMMIDYKIEKEMYDTLWEIAMKREQRVHKQLHSDAWAYLAKYITHFVD